MQRLSDYATDNLPIGPPLGRFVVAAAVFVAAWTLTRLSGRVARWLVDRNERRRPGHEDTGVIASLRQRETSIALIQTSVGYLAYGLAAILAFAALLGARRAETVIGASFVAILLAFAAQRFLMDVVAGLLMFFEGWFRVGDTARTAVAPGREWLADEFLTSLLKERGGERLVVHGPVVTPVDAEATRRYARAVRERR